MLDGFTRALYIEMDLGVDKDELEEKAGRIADDLGLCLQKTKGSLNLLEKTILMALIQGDEEDKAADMQNRFSKSAHKADIHDPKF